MVSIHRHIRRLSLCILALISLVAVPLRLAADSDREAWFYVSAQAPMGRDWTAALNGVARYSDALGGFSDRFVEVQATRRIAASWSLTPSLRVNHGRTGSGLSRREVRAAAAISWQAALQEWKIRLRGRLEYRDFDTISRDGWRFRFRIRIDPPMPAGSRWQPYLSNETFHDRGAVFFDENRFFAGSTVRLAGVWSANLFVGWRHRGNASTLADSVIGGIGLQARF